jgi:hypothetical protein
MKDPSLLASTASEPLTLSEEYEMCSDWRTDPSKHTFIIYEGDTAPEEARGAGFVEGGRGRMVGDVNLFLSLDEEVDDHGNVVVSRLQGELEIMVAEKRARRKGMAEKAIRCMIGYAGEAGVERLFVKIGDGNDASRELFEKKLGFQVVRYVECFKETELELTDFGVAIAYGAVEFSEPTS